MQRFYHCDPSDLTPAALMARWRRIEQLSRWERGGPLDPNVRTVPQLSRRAATKTRSTAGLSAQMALMAALGVKLTPAQRARMTGQQA